LPFPATTAVVESKEIAKIEKNTFFIFIILMIKNYCSLDLDLIRAQVGASIQISMMPNGYR
jgi:hypothetical protein